MRRTAAHLVILLALPTVSLADVVIHTRSTEFRSARSYPFAHSPEDYSDYAFINQLSPNAASATVNLTTFNSEQFSTTAAATGITATMRAETGYGPFNNRERWSSSTWFAVVFEIRTNPQALSVLVDGAVAYNPAGPRTSFSLTIRNLATNATVYDASTTTPPLSGIGAIEWTDDTWTTTLNPGSYVLITQAQAAAPNGNLVGGSASTTSVSVSVTFGPQTAPAVAAALIPAPGAAALLTLLPFAAIRRRR